MLSKLEVLVLSPRDVSIYVLCSCRFHGEAYSTDSKGQAVVIPSLHSLDDASTALRESSVFYSYS
jgi:hypothetical protein